MKKKIYQKPTMQVVKLQHQTQLLVDSNQEPTPKNSPQYFDEEFAYIPNATPHTEV